MSVKGALRILGLGVIAFVVMYVAAVVLEPVDWALRALNLPGVGGGISAWYWQLISESQNLVVVAVLIVVGTLVGIREGALSTRRYRPKNRHLDDSPKHGPGHNAE